MNCKIKLNATEVKYKIICGGSGFDGYEGIKVEFARANTLTL